MLLYDPADIRKRLADTIARMDDMKRAWLANNPGRLFHYSHMGIEYHRLSLLADTYTRLLGGSGSSVQFAPR